jgi:hypothetical protein
MKKVLLIGLILATLLLAMPQGVSAATADVTASIATVSDLTATYIGTSPWVLTTNSANNQPNPPGAIQTTVNCNSDWDVTVADSQFAIPAAVAVGHMVSTTSNKYLATAFVFDGGGLTGPAWVIQSGTPQAITTYKYGIGQPVVPGDDAAESYKITIAFTLVPK